jgi:hypothetical protein
MAKSFIYDSIGFSESPTEDGGFVAGAFDPDISPVTNHQRANDMSISSIITNYNSSGADTIRFSTSSSQSANVIALYFTSAETDDLTLYGHASSSTNMTTSVLAMTTFSEGWNIFTISGTYKYWFLRAITGHINNLTEVIIGTKYDIDMNFDLNNKIGEEFGTDTIISQGGNEYYTKRHAPKTTWDWKWSYLTSGQKTSLDGLNSSVQDYKKFLYYDETDYHYVRMTKPMDFTEVAPDIYSTAFSITEQLS